MDKGSNPTNASSATCIEVFSPVDSRPSHASHLGSQVNQDVTNEDLMLKLCANGSEISKLLQSVDELRAALFSLQADNDKPTKEVMEARKREEALKSELLEVRFTAGLADQRSEELSSYIRRNNSRVYGVTEDNNNGSRGGEEAEETPEEYEKKILSIIRDKLTVDVRREDIEAVHRLGRKQRKTHQEET